MSTKDTSSTPWWRLDPVGDVPSDWGLHCETCKQIACTCHIASSGDLASQADPGPIWDTDQISAASDLASQVDPGPFWGTGR